MSERTIYIKKGTKNGGAKLNHETSYGFVLNGSGDDTPTTEQEQRIIDLELHVHGLKMEKNKLEDKVNRALATLQDQDWDTKSRLEEAIEILKK